MPQIVSVRIRRNFPHSAGLGAAGPFRPATWGVHAILPPIVPVHVTTPVPSTSTTTPATPTTHSPRRPRTGTRSTSTGIATSSDLSAFSQALENAAALGVVSPTQAASYQSAANGATSAQLRQLTSQINSLVASASPAASAAAASSAVAPVDTGASSSSWWDGTTSLLGTQVQNATLVVGGLGVAFFGWLFFGNKKR